MTITQQSKPITGVEQLLPLGKITQRGQYVNRLSGHLLIIDENLEKSLRNSEGLFKGFIAKDLGALEYLKVSENHQLPLEETRSAVAKLSLPVNF